MSQHAIVAPSSAARVVQCPGSLRAEQRYPEVEPGSGAAEGEAAHWVLQQMSGGTIPAIGTLAPNGVAVTDEMLDGAQLAIDTVNADLAPHGMTIRSEERRVGKECRSRWS